MAEDIPINIGQSLLRASVLLPTGLTLDLYRRANTEPPGLLCVGQTMKPLTGAGWEKGPRHYFNEVGEITLEGNNERKLRACAVGPDGHVVIADYGDDATQYMYLIQVAEDGTMEYLDTLSNPTGIPADGWQEIVALHPLTDTTFALVIQGDTTDPLKRGKWAVGIFTIESNIFGGLPAGQLGQFVDSTDPAHGDEPLVADIFAGSFLLPDGKIALLGTRDTVAGPATGGGWEHRNAIVVRVFDPVEIDFVPAGELLVDAATTDSLHLSGTPVGDGQGVFWAYLYNSPSNAAIWCVTLSPDATVLTLDQMPSSDWPINANPPGHWIDSVRTNKAIQADKRLAPGDSDLMVKVNSTTIGWACPIVGDTHDDNEIMVFFWDWVNGKIIEVILVKSGKVFNANTYDDTTNELRNKQPLIGLTNVLYSTAVMVSLNEFFGLGTDFTNSIWGSVAGSINVPYDGPPQPSGPPDDTINDGNFRLLNTIGRNVDVQAPPTTMNPATNPWMIGMGVNPDIAQGLRQATWNGSELVFDDQPEDFIWGLTEDGNTVSWEAHPTDGNLRVLVVKRSVMPSNVLDDTKSRTYGYSQPYLGRVVKSNEVVIPQNGDGDFNLTYDETSYSYWVTTTPGGPGVNQRKYRLGIASDGSMNALFDQWPAPVAIGPTSFRYIAGVSQKMHDLSINLVQAFMLNRNPLSTVDINGSGANIMLERAITGGIAGTTLVTPDGNIPWNARFAGAPELYQTLWAYDRPNARIHEFDYTHPATNGPVEITYGQSFDLPVDFDPDWVYATTYRTPMFRGDRLSIQDPKVGIKRIPTTGGEYVKIAWDLFGDLPGGTKYILVNDLASATHIINCIEQGNPVWDFGATGAAALVFPSSNGNETRYVYVEFDADTYPLPGLATAFADKVGLDETVDPDPDYPNYHAKNGRTAKVFDDVVLSTWQDDADESSFQAKAIRLTDGEAAEVGPQLNYLYPGNGGEFVPDVLRLEDGLAVVLTGVTYAVDHAIVGFVVSVNETTLAVTVLAELPAFTDPDYALMYCARDRRVTVVVKEHDDDKNYLVRVLSDGAGHYSFNKTAIPEVDSDDFWRPSNSLFALVDTGTELWRMIDDVPNGPGGGLDEAFRMKIVKMAYANTGFVDARTLVADDLRGFSALDTYAVQVGGRIDIMNINSCPGTNPGGRPVTFQSVVIATGVVSDVAYMPDAAEDEGYVRTQNYGDIKNLDGTLSVAVTTSERKEVVVYMFDGTNVLLRAVAYDYKVRQQATYDVSTGVSIQPVSGDRAAVVISGTYEENYGGDVLYDSQVFFIDSTLGEPQA